MKQLNFTKGNGLIPAVIQDAQTKDVLMIGFMNRDAYVLSRKTGYVYFWSRTRNALWKKGASSGNTLTIVRMAADCDNDAVLLTVLPNGPTCHTGTRSCFENRRKETTL